VPSQGTVRYNLSSGQDEVGYLLKDRYTVAGLADERGWPVERYDYDAYGKVYMNRCAVLPWAADLDGDGDVDQNDLTVFLDAYGGSGQASNGPRGWRADLDGDVDGSDYVLFADAYNGVGNPPRRPQSPAVSAGCVLTTGPMVVSRVGNPFFFTGRRLDVMDKQTAGTPHHFTDDCAGLQLYDYRARTDEPVMGRFNQRDPLEYADGMNAYEYVRAQPSIRVDPSGRGVKVWFRCTLVSAIATGSGNCDRNCLYSCTETDRVDSGSGGVIGADDLPKPMVITEMETVYGSFLCRWTYGCLGSPATCSNAYDTSHDYNNDSPQRNCSRSACVARCQQVNAASWKLCLALPPVAKQACQAAAAAGLRNCTAMCNAWCLNP